MLIALIMVACSGLSRCLSAEQDPQVASPHLTEDARRVSQLLMREGERLLREGKATSRDELRKQLERPSCTISLPSHGSSKLSPEELYEQCRRSVLVIGHLYRCESCPRYHVQTHTGFILTRSGVFATSYHVFNIPRVESLVAMSSDGRIAGVTQVLAANEANDVVVAQLDGSGYVALPLEGRAAVGTPVWAISHPDHDFYTFTDGIIARYGLQPMGPNEVKLMSVTADFARGSSGAPILNARGAAVGMVRSTRSLYDTEVAGRKEDLQMVFKYCVPAAEILQLFRAVP